MDISQQSEEHLNSKMEQIEISIMSVKRNSMTVCVFRGR